MEKQQNKLAKKTKQTETGKKKERKKKSRTRPVHHRLLATLPNHYTTKTDYVVLSKSFPRKIHRQTPFTCKGGRVAYVRTALLTVKKTTTTKTV